MKGLSEFGSSLDDEMIDDDEVAFDRSTFSAHTSNQLIIEALTSDESSPEISIADAHDGLRSSEPPNPQSPSFCSSFGISPLSCLPTSPSDAVPDVNNASHSDMQTHALPSSVASRPKTSYSRLSTVESSHLFDETALEAAGNESPVTIASSLGPEEVKDKVSAGAAEETSTREYSALPLSAHRPPKSRPLLAIPSQSSSPGGAATARSLSSSGQCSLAQTPIRSPAPSIMHLSAAMSSSSAVVPCLSSSEQPATPQPARLTPAPPFSVKTSSPSSSVSSVRARIAQLEQAETARKGDGLLIPPSRSSTISRSSPSGADLNRSATAISFKVPLFKTWQ